MEFQKGQFVKHRTRAEWGIGKVIGAEDSVVRVLFPQEGEKKLDVRYASLEIVEELPPEWKSEHGELHPKVSINLGELESLCSSFYNEMKDNRPNTDDGKMAQNVLRDMQARGNLTRASTRQLFAWCHTTGNPYQRGVDAARQICRAIYGRVPTPKEIEELRL
jgi:hypothetical protein